MTSFAAFLGRYEDVVDGWSKSIRLMVPSFFFSSIADDDDDDDLALDGAPFDSDAIQ